MYLPRGWRGLPTFETWAEADNLFFRLANLREIVRLSSGERRMMFEAELRELRKELRRRLQKRRAERLTDR